MSIEKNHLSFPNLKLFELEKVFKKNNNNSVEENYDLT
jgi:hypothetical protein